MVRKRITIAFIATWEQECSEAEVLAAFKDIEAEVLAAFKDILESGPDPLYPEELESMQVSIEDHPNAE